MSSAVQSRPLANDPSADSSMSRPASAGKDVWIGRVLSGLAVLFLAFDAGVKVIQSFRTSFFRSTSHSCFGADSGSATAGSARS